MSNSNERESRSIVKNANVGWNGFTVSDLTMQVIAHNVHPELDINHGCRVLAVQCLANRITDTMLRIRCDMKLNLPVDILPSFLIFVHLHF